MLYEGAIKMVRGEKYTVFTLTSERIDAGTLICYKNGRTVRKVLCRDGNEVVVRGYGEGRDLFEAVPADAIVDQWYGLEPVA